MKQQQTTTRLDLQGSKAQRVQVGLFVLIAASTLVGTYSALHGPTWAQGTSPPPSPQFTVPSTLVTASGSVSLKWQVPAVLPSDHFELEQAVQENFFSPEAVYSGPDRGTYLSGLPDGDYYYRVRVVNTQEEKPSQWSPSVHRSVQHPSLEFTFTMLGVGATVFLSTIGVIVQGARKETTGG